MSALRTKSETGERGSKKWACTRERIRNSYMRKAYETLKDLIPYAQGKKMTKIELLRATIDHIHMLERMLIETIDSPVGPIFTPCLEVAFLPDQTRNTAEENLKMESAIN